MKKTTQRKLDEAFSKYIRLRDANEDGYIRCISCGKVVHWKEADVGHYILRKHMSLRYNGTNCNAQCRECNRFDESNAAGYTLGLIERYGTGIIETLNAFKHQQNKISETEAQAMLKFYNLETKELMKP